MIRLLFETLSADPIGLVSKGGLLVALLVALYGGAKENPWWVFGRTHRESLEREKEWKAMALAGTDIADKALEVKVKGR